MIFIYFFSVQGALKLVKYARILNSNKDGYTLVHGPYGIDHKKSGL